jgi:hypothetical protein
MYSDDRLTRPFFLADIFKKTRGGIATEATERMSSGSSLGYFE